MAKAADAFQMADLAPPPEHPAEETHTGTEHAGDAHGAKPGLPQLDVTTFASQLFWLVISFAVLYAVISRIAVPKISGVLADRAGRIKGDLDQAALAKANSDAAIANYEKALAEARTRALKLGDEMRSSAMARVGDVAREAAAEIIAKLTGEAANASDLDAAVRNALKPS